MKERNKAIRQAWKREQELVSEGKGTRDWTKEQQQDILNPDKGKAYDDDGYAFVGQHMKSAARYPEYQGDPDNIQFLTNEEHLAAHKGSWQNPTNWYYNPDTKEYVEFGEEELIPCKVIDLNDPIKVVEISKEENDSTVVENSTDNEGKIEREEVNQKETNVEPQPTIENRNKNSSETPPPVKKSVTKTPVKKNIFIRGLKATGRFIVEHPVESLEIAGVVIGGAKTLLSKKSGKSSTSSVSRSTSSSPSTKSDVSSQIAEIIEKANRTSPKEHDVSAHRQRYHYKDGSVKWKDKAPYHKGGKDN